MGLVEILKMWVIQARKNHALEHATIHVLSERWPNLQLMGRTTPWGFYLYGSVSTEAVRNAVAEAMIRLRRGEYQLAVHPRCGTNLVTAGVLTGLASFAVMLPSGRRSRLLRLPEVLFASLIALLLAQPAGRWIQERLTTDPDVHNLAVTDISRRLMGNTVVHRIRTHPVLA